MLHIKTWLNCQIDSTKIIAQTLYIIHLTLRKNSMPKHAKSPNLAKSIILFVGYLGSLFYSTKSVNASKTEFPVEGTFAEQTAFVNNLPKSCSEGSAKLINSITEMDNPFGYTPPHRYGIGDLSDKYDIETWRHSFDAEFGTLTKRTKGEYSDETTITLAGEGSEPVVFHFKQTSNGDWKPVKKEKVAMAVYSAGIDQAENEGLIVKAKKTDFLGNTETCFTAQTKKAKVS